MLSKFMFRNLKNTIREVALLFGLVLIGIVQGNTQNTISVGSYNIQHSTQFLVDVEVTNTDPVSVFQTDITIPDGLSYVAGSAGLNISRSDGHQLSATLNGNILRLVVYTFGSGSLIGSSGSVVNFNLETETTPGDFTLSLSESYLSGITGTDLLTGTSNGTVTILAPDINTSVTSIDFGRVALQSNSNKSFTVSNPGNQNLVVSGISVSEPQFSTAQSAGFTLTAGGNQSVSVNFSPTVKGTYSEQISILSNDPDEATSIVTIHAIGYAVNELHIGNFTGASGTTGQLSFAINNMENFTGFQFELVLPAPLSYVASSAVLSSRANGQSVSAFMTSATVLTIIAYSANSNTFSENTGDILTLDFNINGVAGNYNLNIQNVIISDEAGSNIISDSYNGTLTVSAPDIYISPTSYNFGDVSILETGSKTINIRNTGQQPLNITHLIFSNTLFTSAQTLPFTIAAGGNRNISVRFQKTERGSESGTLEIRSNDPNENPFTINLSANAFVPNYILATTNSIEQGGSSNISVEINNEETFVAFQFDLTYPAGLIPNLDNVELTSRNNEHTVVATSSGINKIRIFAYSNNTNPFSGSTGNVVNIPFTANLEINNGSYPLILSEGVLSNEQSENILWETQNGSVNMSEKSGIKLNAKVFLEGPFNGSAMNTNLNTNGLIPLDQPYNTSPCNYSGTETVATVPAGVVDWVLVELRQATEAANANEATMLEKRAAFIKPDGTIVDIDGTSPVEFENTLTAGNNLYVVVRHRNHLAIMSNSGASLNGSVYDYDFTTAITQTYGGGNGFKEISTGVFGMVAGDANSDQSVYINDYTDFWIPESGSNNIYNSVDFNLDGQIYINDYTDFWIPNSGKFIVIPN